MDTTLIQLYDIAANTSSDINQHIPTLRKYASECTSIAECGVRTVVSTWAFVRGLCDNQSVGTKILYGSDLVRSPNINAVERVCKGVGIDYKFIEGNDLDITLPPTDMVFIDTWHIYGHLKHELRKFHPIATKYLIMHDTTVDAIHGETVRLGWDPYKQSKDTGYPVEDITKGLWPAIEEFLFWHPEWKLKERYTNNNGLTILERI